MVHAAFQFTWPEGSGYNNMASAVAALSTAGNTNVSQTASTPATPASIRIKQERPDDAEINELAAKMVEANKAKMAAQAAQAAQQAAARPHLLQSVQGQTNIMNYMTRKNQPPEKTESEKTQAIDEESACGHFSWTTLGKCHLPYIFRSGEKYLAVRMVESKVLNKYLTSLHSDIYNCTCIRSYYITEVEARLLNEINIRHCEYQFGREQFNVKDLVVRLQDATEFYNFLDICYNKLLMGTSDTNEKCGFVRINGESVVPYTLRENRKFVPLFYFEGETDNLKLRAEILEGWDLAYLKFCCKVQGIRNELFANDTCAVISLDDIKSYFPPGTLFEDYWPNKAVDNQLLLAGNKSSVGPPGGMWTKQPPTTPTGQKTPTPRATNSMSVPQSQQSPLQNIQQMQFQQMQMSQMQQQSVGQQRGSSSSMNMPVVNGWSGIVNGQPTYQQAVPQQTSVSSRMAQSAMSMHNVNPNTTRSSSYNTARSRNQYYSQAALSMASTQANSLATTQPPPLVRATIGSGSVNTLSMPVVTPSTMHLMGTSSNHSTVSQLPQYSTSHQQPATTNSKYPPPPLVHINGTTAYASSGTFPSDIIDLSSPPQSPHSRVVAGSRSNVNGNNNNNMNKNNSASSNTAEQPKLIPIPDHTTTGSHIPYQVQKALVESKMVPCINFKPYIYTELLMTLPDLIEHFFPNVSAKDCHKTVQDVLGLDLFRGNKQQMAILHEAGKCKSSSEVLPLIQIKDVMQFMPQMKYIFSNIRNQNNQARGDESAAKRARIS